MHRQIFLCVAMSRNALELSSQVTAWPHVRSRLLAYGRIASMTRDQFSVPYPREQLCADVQHWIYETSFARDEQRRAQRLEPDDLPGSL